MFRGIARLFKSVILLPALPILLLWAVDAGATWDNWGPPYPYPEIITSDAFYSYTYNSKTGIGTFTMIGIVDTLYLPNGTHTNIMGGEFTLTASFSNGVFVRGTLDITGKALALPGHNDGKGYYPGFDSGTLLESTQLSFMGITGSGKVGDFQFEGSDYPGTDFYKYYNGKEPYAYVVAVVTGMTGNWSGSWNSPLFWERGFSGTANDTAWAPIPGSILIFGAGLTVVFGLSRRKSWRKRSGNPLL